MGLTAGSEDPACQQAAYLELQRRNAAIQNGVAAWRNGDVGGLALARVELARLEATLAHPFWSEPLKATVDKTRTAAAGLSQALKDKDQARAEAAVRSLADAAYYVATAYYHYWLPSGVLLNTAVQEGVGASVGGHGDSHGGTATPAAQANPGPNWLVVGGFGLAIASVIAAAWVLKRSMAAGDAAETREEPVGV